MKRQPISSPTLLELGYYNEAQFAKLAKKTKLTLRNWRSQRIGPPYTKLGNCVAYPIEGVRAWLKGGTVVPAEQPTLIDSRGRRRASTQPTA